MTKVQTRLDGRKLDEMRKIEFHVNYLANAEGSCLIKLGNTWVICTASIEDRVPHFLRNTGNGWLSAEYGMLPRSTNSRMQREVNKGSVSGRTQEIQRLIGRSLRAAVNFAELGERHVVIDCDVIQADGGTRTAAINGGYVALHLALRNLYVKRLIRKIPIIRHVSAISCGIVNGDVMLDLAYTEDSNADVDANFICSSDNRMIEMQCTGEKNNFSQEEVIAMMEISKKACNEIMNEQKIALNLNNAN